MSELLQVHEGLHEKGYVPVGIDLGRSDLQTAIDRYTAFLEIDEQYHELTRFLSTPRGDGDFGQYRRVSGGQGERGEIADNKDIFHFGVQSRQVIESRLRGALPEDMKNFLNVAEEIYWAAQRSKRQTLQELDHYGMGLVGIMQPEVGTINDVLRFITYYPNEEKLAKGHFDRSTCTLAIGESHEGLRVAPGQNGLKVDANEEYLATLEERLQPVEHVEGEAKFFLGAGWNRLPMRYNSGGRNEDLPLAWHDVIPSDKQVDEKVMRWAVVMFINPKVEFEGYYVPSPAETRPYKQLGRLTLG